MATTQSKDQTAGNPPVKTEQETLVEAIRRIGDGVKRLNATGLNRTGVVVLMHDYTKVSKKLIIKVLDGLKEIEREYCEPRKSH